MPVKVVDWAAHDATLREMAKAGKSGAMIAAAIPGATKSGVIGRLRRIGVPLKRPKAAKPITPPKAERRHPFRPKVPIKAPIETRIAARSETPPTVAVPGREIAFLAPAGAVPMLSLDAIGACRWPYNDRDGVARLACGATTGSNDPSCIYCAGHRALAYQPRVAREHR